jgi:2-phospho-L-lactate/phosphoenolpyruvate guanylyltransferase
MTAPFSSSMTGLPAGRSGTPWSIIIPVKRVAAGKSRLRATPRADDALVLAIALDTIAAALAAGPVATVVVVTNDAAVATAATGLGAKIVSDAPDAGLNAAIRHGADTIGDGCARAALTADLPALRPADLAAALDAAAATAAGRRCFVADHAGTGTTLLMAPPAVPLDPRFGPGSARAHAASGALALSGAWPSLRLDVDTPADLDAASALGLGPRTLARMGGVQGTVATYDPDHRTGTVLLDDGTEVAFDAAAFAASGLRLLRFGQRLRLVRDSTGRVVEVALPTM